MAHQQPESTQKTCQDLVDARSKASFSIDEMSIVYARSKQVRDTRRWLVSLLKQDPVFDRTKKHFMSRLERFQNGYKQALAYFKIRNKHGLAKIERDQLRIYIDDYIPVWLHDSMAYSTVQAQASQEQLVDMGWEANMRDGRWIGCYAQTELRHGSNLSALQTTATFDQKTDEWVIHTPDPADAKYWVGGLGKTATHAIVQAKLIIHGKDYGLHPLLVNIRDLKTHKVLDGLEIHDIGPKLGSEAMDNGYMRFTHYRTPRKTLLMKNLEVSRTGEYKYLNPSAKILARGTMSLVRVFLVDLAVHNLSRALTIAIRYSFIRRQGTSKSGAEEPRIAEYKSIQLRTLPYLAQVYPLLFASFYLRDLYNSQQDRLKADPFSKDTGERLAELHAWSSGLKAYATQTALEGANYAKESCGGIGYHKFAGFNFIASHPSAGVIIEGENWVLYGETCKYLVRNLTNAKSKITEYLTAPDTDHWPASTSQITDTKLQIQLLESRSRTLVKEARDRAVKGAIDHEDAYNASRAHIQLFILANYEPYLSTLEISQASRKVLLMMKDLYFCTTVLTNLGHFRLLTSEQIQAIRTLRDRLLPQVSLESCGLVDAFDFDDWYLDSCIGNSRGDVYGDMYRMLRREPLNVEGEGMSDGVVKGWFDTLQHVVDGETGVFQERKSKL